MNLNAFQIDTQEKLKDVLERNDLDAAFETGGGPDQYGIKVTIGKYVSWIYPDGADVIGPDLDKRFEIYDFTSLDELKTAYLEFVQAAAERFKT